MSEIKYQDHILEAIDQLRRRKARPDADRIFNSLTRRHAIDFTDAKTALEQCVQNGVVLKVEYKGNISYRNAAKKFSHLKRDSQGEVIRDTNKPNKNFTGLLTRAIAELVLIEPDYLELGVPGGELIKSILSKDSVRYTKKYVSILLDKEVESGSLIRMENGNFLVGPAKSDVQNRKLETEHIKFSDLTTDNNHEIIFGEVKLKRKPGPKPGLKKEKSIDTFILSGKIDNGKLRVGGRRKRAKKVFDPSDNNIPKKRGRPVGSLNKSTIEKQLAKLSDNDSRPESRSSNNSHKEQGGVCYVCHLQNKKGSNDRMISCRECSNKAHFSCLNGEDMMLGMCPDNTWQCPHCKTCVTCYETSDAGYLAVCSICADAYHLGCHQPKIIEKIKPGSRWLCINCQMPEQLVVNDIQLGFGNVDTLPKERGESMSPTSPFSGNSSPINFNTSPTPPSPTPPTLSPQAHLNGHRASPAFSIKSESPSFKDLDLDENIDPSIPDASNWTYDEVYNYFAQYFPEEAKVFKEQEIDGPSLLLMKRIDVLTSLKLKLGPALKIYRHVVKLQVRRDDPKLYWL
ncbi:PHD finger motif containing protein [Oryctes borbonicus]|uniref:PHD finger motif containing protein n=1 Tax=Oryctes borbonicus TaxID=1629725 RepID=A0A0T6BBT1_9SCAR|nr:PHD finger motif containing protein [Oryctes borbonicus]